MDVGVDEDEHHGHLGRGGGELLSPRPGAVRAA